MKYEKFDLRVSGGDEILPDEGEEHAIARSANRELLSLFCMLRGRTSDWRYVRISDLSSLGFRVWWHELASTGDAVKVRIKGLEDRAAEVRWTSGHWIGCQFVQPLSPYVVEHIANQTRQSPPSYMSPGA